MRVNREVGGHCSGFAISLNTVVTAAHCLWLDRPRSWIRPSSLHVLVGYDRGAFRQHLRVTSYRVAKSYRPGGKPGSAKGGADWALLDLDRPFDGAPLPLASRAPVPGLVLSISGFARTRLHRVTHMPTCRVTRVGGDRFLHECAAVSGLSGAPVFGWLDGQRAAFGVHTASGAGQGLAYSAIAIRDRNARQPY